MQKRTQSDPGLARLAKLIADEEAEYWDVPTSRLQRLFGLTPTGAGEPGSDSSGAGPH